MQRVAVEAHVRAKRISYNAGQGQLTDIPPKRVLGAGSSHKLRKVEASLPPQLGGVQRSGRRVCGRIPPGCSAGEQL